MVKIRSSVRRVLFKTRLSKIKHGYGALIVAEGSSCLTLPDVFDIAETDIPLRERR